jgi:carboxymethylenebutenolidase
MKEAKKSLEVHWYDANHAFANPTGDNYDQDDAKLAWRRTLDFLGRHLGT